MTETALVRSILRTLQMKGVWSWRVNSGMQRATYHGKDRFIKLAPAGSPDILGVIGDGRLFGLEVKTETGRVLATQQRWHDKAARHGVRVAVVRSVGEAVRVVEEWRKG